MTQNLRHEIETFFMILMEKQLACHGKKNYESAH